MEKLLDFFTSVNQEDTYSARGLDMCGVCGLKYNVGERIPRILVNCGHTYCSGCLIKYFRKGRVRCPFCKKLVKNLESVEQLPLNISIFAELIDMDRTMLNILDLDNSNSYISNCRYHPEKQRHFYCSYHVINFCRECIKAYHRENKCCVVDVNDINKLYQLNEQNKYKNYLIVKSRSRLRNGKRLHKEEFFISNN
jgi:hypothetical protein